MKTSLTLFGETNPNTGEFELNINNIKLSDFEITNSNVDYLDDSIIINATTTNELAKVDSLVIPLYSNGEEIADIHPIVTKETYGATLKDIVPFMKDMLEMFGGSITPSDLKTFEITLNINEDLEGIKWATFAKQLMDNKNILIPYSDGSNIQIVGTLGYDETRGIYNIDKELVTYEETNLFKNSIIYVLGDNNSYTINLSDGVDTNSMSFEPVDISNHKVFESDIFRSTVAKSILDKDDTLTIPEIVKVNELFYGKEVYSKTLRVDQVEALFNSLFVSTNGQAITINHFTTDEMMLPTDRTLIESMLESLIVSATMSTKIIEGSIVVLEKVMTAYEYDNNNDGILDRDSDLYINKEELINLIQALSCGLEKTLISDLTFADINIPTEEKADYLLASELIRTTITREIMKQEKISIEVGVFDNPAPYLYNSTQQVAVISKEEIKLLIHGLNELNDNENKVFGNIQISINDLVGDKDKDGNGYGDKLEAVANSSVLRSVISNTLKETTPLGIPYYQTIFMSDPAIVTAYNTFNLDSVEIGLFSKVEILSLQDKM